jgi:glycosyltransferase involved in cell wall biosynthesis
MEVSSRRMNDRFSIEGKGIDVLLLTLDAEKFLQRSLESLYAEVPVARLLVCDGGSKDATIAILNKFPRLQLYVKPEIRTTGKALQFLFSNANTEWIMITDSDLTFPPGWYDEMCRHRNEFDAFDSKRLHAYEFYREDPETTRLEMRPLVNSPQMGKLEALRNFKVDDDYVQRITDVATRQTIEKAGYRYGKVTTTHHFHHTTEETKYASDPTKAATKIVFERPNEIVVNPEKWRKRLVDNAKGFVKYIDPDLPYVKNDPSIDRSLLPLLDREWVLQNGPAWIRRYDRARSVLNPWRVRRLLYRFDAFLHAIDRRLHRQARTSVD